MKKIYALLLGFCLCAAIHAQTSWKGTTSSNWNTAANWTAGVPTSATDAIIGDANFTGPNQPTVNSGSANCRSLTIGAGTITSTLTIGRNLNCYGNLTIGANGSVLQSANNRIITLRGNWTNNGTYSSTGNNTGVTFSGTAQTISGATTFRAFTINSGSVVTLASNIAVTNSATINGTLDPATFILSGAGSASVNAGATLMVKAATFAGNYTFSGGLTLSGTSTVHYASSSINQTVSSAFTYGYLRISGGTTKSLAANLPALNSGSVNSGRVYIDAGTFDLQSFTCNRGTSTAGGSFTIAGGATLKIGGTNTFPLNYASVNLASISTVNYSGTNQTVTALTYGHLSLESSSGAAVKTMPATTLTIAGNFTSAQGSGTSVSCTAAGAITVNGNVSIGSGTTFNASSHSHTFKGNFTNNGTFTGATSTVSFSGTATSISGTGTFNFFNVTFAANGITAAGASALNIGGNVAGTGAATFEHLSGGTTSLTGTAKTISGTGITFHHLVVSGTITTSAVFAVSGNLNTTGSLIASTPSVLLMTGAAKTITNTSTCTLYSLQASGTISTTSSFTITGNVTVPVGGSLTATAGTITLNGTSSLSGTANLFNVTINATKSLVLGTNSTLGIAGSFSKPGTLDVTTSVPNTVAYNGAGAQTITNAIYNNLTLATSGTKTPGGNFTVNRDLTISTGTTLNASTSSLTVNRHFVNAGTFTGSSSTITFSGADVTIITGNTTFNNVVVNKTNNSISVELASGITTNDLTVTTGNMQTGTNSVTITGTRTGSGIIIGTITHSHVFLTGVSYYFEGPNNFLSFLTPSASLTSVTVIATPGPVANMDPWLESVNREYEIIIPNGSYTSATFRYHYEDLELNAFVEPTLTLYKYNTGVQWDSVGFTSRNSTSNYVEYSGMTSVTGRYTASGIRSIVRWNGSISSAWETAGNWTPVSGTNMTPRVPLPTDAVYIGHATYTNAPVINSVQQVGLLEFGSAQNSSLTISSGSLTVLGSAKGKWSGSASHNINVNGGSMSVGTYFILSDGIAGHGISLNIGSGSVTVNGDLVHQSPGAVTFTGTGSLNVAGHYDYTSGTFTAGNGTVVYSGSEAQDVAPVTYNHLSVAKSTARATIYSAVTVNGNLTTSTGGELYADASIDVAGNVTIGANTNFIENDVQIYTGGNWTTNGVFTVNNGSVTFDGGGTQNVNANTFNTVVVNKALGTVVLTGNISLNSDLTVAAGTMDLASFSANRTNAGGTLTLGNNAVMKIAGANNFPQNFAINTLAVTSTVEYNGSSAQNIANATYGNLTLTNGIAQAKSLVSNTDVAGNLFISNTATYNPGSLTTHLGGNFTCNGTYTPGTSTLKLNGTGKTFSGTLIMYNLIVSGSYTVISGTTMISGDAFIQTGATLDFGTNTVTLDGDLTVNGTLMSAGIANFSGTRVQTLQLTNAVVSSSTGVVNFNGTVAPILNSNTSPQFANVNINNTAGIAPSVPWTVIYSCNVAAGSAFHGGALTHTFYGTFINNGTVSSSGELKFIPQLPYCASATVQLDGVSFTSTGLITFGGSVPITIVNSNPVLNRVSITNTDAGGVTAPSSWTLNGEFFVAANSIFNAGAGFTHNMQDNLTNNGTFNGQTSTVVFNGSGVAINGLGTTNFANLTIAVAADVTMNQNIGVSSNLVVDGLLTSLGRTLIMNGNAPGTISGAQGALTLDDMEQNKSGSYTALLIPVTVTGDLTMTNGIIRTTAVNLLSLTDNATSTSGNATSFVDGPMKKTGNDAFVFPLGDSTFWARLAISAPAQTTDAFTAQYRAASYANTTSMASNPSPVLNNVSTIEYWTCDRTAGTSSVNVTLYWENSVRSAITSYTPDLVVARWNGSAWENAGQSAINPSSPGFVTSANVSSFSPFTFGSLSGMNPLPIQLVNFTATLNSDNQVDLAWSTAVEINNDYFEVQRTSDGVHYETIAVVAGAGTSSQPHYYTAVDVQPLNGISWYRLKQVDGNGSSTYSDLRTITYEPRMQEGVSVYPNPADGAAVNIAVAATADDQIIVSFYNADGKLCHQETATASQDGVNTLHISFATVLPAGIYLMDITVASGSNVHLQEKQKLIVR